MKSTYSFYAETVEEALFGVDVTKGRAASEPQIYINDDVELMVFEGEEQIPESAGTLVREVTLDEILRRRACSPVDPEGRNALDALASLGIDLE